VLIHSKVLLLRNLDIVILIDQVLTMRKTLEWLGGPALAVSVVIPLGQVIEWNRFPDPLQAEDTGPH